LRRIVGFCRETAQGLAVALAREMRDDSSCDVVMGVAGRVGRRARQRDGHGGWGGNVDAAGGVDTGTRRGEHQFCGIVDGGDGDGQWDDGGDGDGVGGDAAAGAGRTSIFFAQRPVLADRDAGGRAAAWGHAGTDAADDPDARVQPGANVGAGDGERARLCGSDARGSIFTGAGVDGQAAGDRDGAGLSADGGFRDGGSDGALEG